MVELSEKERKELLKIFKTESEEQIVKIGKSILELEKEPNNNELIDKLLRETHSLKGSCGMLGFTTMQELAHYMEDVFKLIKERRIETNNNVTNILFECLDNITTLRDLRVDEKDSEIDLSDLKSKLAILNSGRIIAYKQKFDNDGKCARERVIERLFVDVEEERELRDEEVEKYQKIKAAIEELSKDFDDVIAEHETRVAEGYSGVIKTIPRLQIDDTIRVSSKEIDEIIGLVEKLEKEKKLGRDEILRLKEELLKLRIVRFSKLFDLLPRLVRELAKTLGKEVELITKGADLEVDKRVLENLKDPFVHIIRNAVDHGIEKPRERQILGKTRIGKITIAVEKKDGLIIVEISDDGRGIDIERIKKKILEKELVDEKDIKKMTISDLLEFLFKPGFSTSKEVDIVSGRGVGLDVVKSNIEDLGGTIEVETKPEKGTRFILKIPLKNSFIK